MCSRRQRQDAAHEAIQDGRASEWPRPNFNRSPCRHTRCGARAEKYGQVRGGEDGLSRCESAVRGGEDRETCHEERAGLSSYIIKRGPPSDSDLNENALSWESWLIRPPDTREIPSSSLGESTSSGPFQTFCLPAVTFSVHKLLHLHSSASCGPSYIFVPRRSRVLPSMPLTLRPSLPAASYTQGPSPFGPLFQQQQQSEEVIPSPNHVFTFFTLRI